MVLSRCLKDGDERPTLASSCKSPPFRQNSCLGWLQVQPVEVKFKGKKGPKCNQLQGAVTPASSSMTRVSAAMKYLAPRIISGAAMVLELAGWSKR